MTPGLAFLIAELTKMGLEMAMKYGSLDSLTEEQAQQTIKEMAAKLELTLPTPEQLEQPK